MTVFPPIFPLCSACWTSSRRRKPSAYRQAQYREEEHPARPEGWVDRCSTYWKTKRREVRRQTGGIKLTFICSFDFLWPVRSGFSYTVANTPKDVGQETCMNNEYYWGRREHSLNEGIMKAEAWFGCSLGIAKVTSDVLNLDKETWWLLVRM